MLRRQQTPGADSRPLSSSLRIRYRSVDLQIPLNPSEMGDRRVSSFAVGCIDIDYARGCSVATHGRASAA